MIFLFTFLHVCHEIHFVKAIRKLLEFAVKGKNEFYTTTADRLSDVSRLMYSQHFQSSFSLTCTKRKRMIVV